MIPVAPQDLPKHQDWVEAGLQEVLRKTGEKWSPSQVIRALYDKAAFLYVSEDGFVILQEHREEWTGEPYVFVWVMWFRRQAAKRIRGALIDWLDDATRKLGYRKWKFISPRLGWKALDECRVEKVIYGRVI